MTTRYFRGDAIDQVFAEIDSGSAEWLLGDHLGTIRHITDSTGASQNARTFDAFGQLTGQSNGTYSSRYTFASREYDVETEFLYKRARYYSPAIGRWTSEDPRDFGAGDSNLYRYVMNQPTGRTDPSGMSDVPRSAVVKRHFDFLSGKSAQPLPPIPDHLKQSKFYRRLEVQEAVRESLKNTGAFVKAMQADNDALVGCNRSSPKNFVGKSRFFQHVL